MRNENLPKKEGGAVPAPSIPAPTEVRERVEWVYISSSYSYIYTFLGKKPPPMSPMTRMIHKCSD